MSGGYHEPDQLAQQLAEFPNELARAIADKSDEALSLPSSDGGWGVVEILPHLRDWEEITLARVQVILSEDTPVLEAFDDELWVIERDYRSQDPRKTLNQFRELREQVIALIENLDQAGWERQAEHAIHGTITLRQLLERVHNHDRDHLDQIHQALA